MCALTTEKARRFLLSTTIIIYTLKNFVIKYTCCLNQLYTIMLCLELFKLYMYINMYILCN
jgi:hypothetical protein